MMLFKLRAWKHHCPYSVPFSSRQRTIKSCSTYIKIGSLTFHCFNFEFEWWTEWKKVVIFVLRINYYSVIICVQIKIMARNNGCEKLLYNRRKSLWTIKKTFKVKQKDPEQDQHRHKNVMCQMKHSENKMRYVFI